MLDAFWSDLRFTGRLLRKNPGFAVTALLTLALGIGANTAVFSLVDHVVLRPLVYRDAGRLYAIQEVVPKFSAIAPMVPVNALHFNTWRKTARSFEDMALLAGITLNLTGVGEPQQLHAARASWNLFSLLGVRPILGRSFRAEEDRPGHDQVVVLNNELWRARFASDPGIIGRKVMLGGKPYEVIGVLPASFHFPKLGQLYALNIDEDKPQIWKPFAIEDDELELMGDFNFSCIARVKSGVTAASALAELNVMQADLARQAPEKIELRAALVPLQMQVTGGSRLGLELALAAVSLVLLIACVNIANLLLTRATVRGREMAIRVAIGASRGRLLRQSLTESLALAGGGGLLGMAIAWAIIRAIASHATLDIPRQDELRMDGRILLFTAAVSLFAGLFFGLLPAWRAASSDPQEAMRSGARGATVARGDVRLRAFLVGGEVFLSAICLMAGGLLLHSFLNLLSVDKGFQVEHIVSVDLSLPELRYHDVEGKAVFLKKVLDKLETLPGIESAGLTNRLPVSGEGGNNMVATEESRLPMEDRLLADIRQVSPHYLDLMSIPLRAGRTFRDSDGKRQVAVVSAMTAGRLWPGQNPIGKRFRQGGDDSPLMEVLGVAGDVSGASMAARPTMTVYVPYWQKLWGNPTLVVKTPMSLGAAAGEIRTVIHQLDPEMPVSAFRTMQDVIDTSLAQRRFQMDLVLLFAVTALLLATLGIYGVVSYSVAQRANEIGIRMTLGAQRSTISGMVLRDGLRPVMFGLVAADVTSVAIRRGLASLLYGVKVIDPITIVGVIVVLSAMSAAAVLWPAWRATKVDASVALRYE